MIRGTDFILNPDKLEEQFQLVEVSEWIDYNTKEKLGFYLRKSKLALKMPISLCLMKNWSKEDK